MGRRLSGSMALTGDSIRIDSFSTATSSKV